MIWPIWDFHVALCRKIADISPKSRCSSGSSGRMFSSACICTKNQWPSAAKPFGRGHFSWVKPEESWLTFSSPTCEPPLWKNKQTHTHTFVMFVFLDNIQPKSSESYSSLFWTRLIWFTSKHLGITTFLRIMEYMTVSQSCSDTFREDPWVIPNESTFWGFRSARPPRLHGSRVKLSKSLK